MPGPIFISFQSRNCSRIFYTLGGQQFLAHVSCTAVNILALSAGIESSLQDTVATGAAVATCKICNSQSFVKMGCCQQIFDVVRH